MGAVDVAVLDDICCAAASAAIDYCSPELLDIVVELERRSKLEAHVFHEKLGGDHEERFAVDFLF